MAHFRKAKKADMVSLIRVLGLGYNDGDTKTVLKEKICQSETYEEARVKEILEDIVEERECEERREREEAERAEKRAEAERAEKRAEAERAEKRAEAERAEKRAEAERAERRAEKQAELERAERKEEKEREEREKIREHELKLQELSVHQNSSGEALNGRNISTDRDFAKYVKLVKEQLPKAPHKTENWVFFFHQAETIFEIYEIPEEFQGKIILQKLSDFTHNLTNSLKLEKLTNYKAIKECILAENRLTPLQHKRNFEKCEKRVDENYLQWATRVKTSLEYYLQSREINDLQSLKELLIADHMKELLSPHVKSHVLIKEGMKWLKPVDLANEVDMFIEAQPKGAIYNGHHSDKHKGGKFPNESKERVEPKYKFNSNKSMNAKDIYTENRKVDKTKIRCFECNLNGHYRYQCPRLKSDNQKERKVNQVCVKVGVNAIKSDHREILDEQSLPMVNINIGGKKISAIRDSGTQICVFHKDMIPDEDRTSGKIYLVPAMGEMQPADLVTIPIALWGDNSSINPEIEITAALTPKLNCPALVTPAVYDELVKQAQLYQVSVALEEPLDNLMGDEKTGEKGTQSQGTSGPGEDGIELHMVTELSMTDPEGEKLIDRGIEVTETEKKSDFHSQSRLFRNQQKECTTLKSAWEEAREGKNSYFIEDGLLYRMNTVINESTKQLVLPECRRKEVLRLAHNHSTAGHLAAAKTLERIKLSFFWEGVRKEVKMYCSACEECQFRRKVRVADRIPIQPVARPELPFQVINADLIGPIEPCSGRGHAYVLCVVDQHSRWPEAIPLKSLTAKATCEAFLQIFMRMGVPQVIAMDNATNFASKLTKEFLKHLGAVPRFSTPGYPLSNGLVERYNGSLKNMLHHAIRNHGKNWDKILPFLLWASREAVNETIGISPFQLMYGRLPNGPLALLKTCWEGETAIPENIGPNTSGYLEQLRENLESASAFAAKVAEKKQAAYAHRYNLRSSNKCFQVGDKVIVLIPDSTNKLFSRWTGPGVIVDTKSQHSFLVELPDGSKRHLHQNKLRGYIQSVATIGLVYEADEEFGDIQHAPVTESGVSEEKFESIIASKIDHLNQGQQRPLRQILGQFARLFTGEVKQAKVGSHSIRLRPEVERKQPHIYRVPEILKPIVEDQIEDLLSKNLIEPSEAEIAYPLVCVAKKDSSVRICVDYRGLNAASQVKPFPMQNATELRYKAGAAKYLSTLDILKGYWTIPMETESRELTSFISPKGQFQWRVMPFGLNGSAATFQKTMNIALKKHRDYADSYIDDIIIFSMTWEDHLQHLRMVLNTLKELDFSANLEKCHFIRGKVTYLGHVVGSGEHGPDPEKLKTIEGLDSPTNKKELRSVLGLFNYYREYVPRFAEIAHPLTALTRKNVPNEIPWSKEADEAFKKLKMALCKAVSLQTPDVTKPFVISVDASDLGIGASLGQRNEHDKIVPITFASQKLTDTQKRWAAIEKEAYAVIWALGKFETWVFGGVIQMYTDHNPLKYLTESAPKNAKLQRWLLALQRYNVIINYKPGASNQDADALSRLATNAWRIPNLDK